jgi:hypothetical protein
MLLRLLPNGISWLAASLAVTLGSGACLAQEVGFVGCVATFRVAGW